MSVRFTASQDLRRTANLPSQTAFTFCGWASMSVDRNTFSTICGFESATSGGAGLYLITDSDGTTLRVFDSGPATFWTGSLAALTVDNPFFWALTRIGTAGAQGHAYYRSIEQQALASVAQGAASQSFTPAVVFFGTDSSAELWNGRLWNVMAFDRELDARELLLQSYRTAPYDPTNLNFWWPLRGIEDQYDRSPNRRDPTVTGTLLSDWQPTRKRHAKSEFANGAAADILMGQALL